MQHIFPLDAQPVHDHCRECGGEEYEGSCGSLSRYLIVSLSRDGVVDTYYEGDVCSFCSAVIKEMSLVKEPVAKRIFEDLEKPN